MSAIRSKIVNLVELGPASRLEKIIEVAVQAKHVKSERLRVLDLGSGGAKYLAPILKRFGSAIELHLLDPAKPTILDDLSKFSTIHHLFGFASDNLSNLKTTSLL